MFKRILEWLKPQPVKLIAGKYVANCFDCGFPFEPNHNLMRKCVDGKFYCRDHLPEVTGRPYYKELSHEESANV